MKAAENIARILKERLRTKEDVARAAHYCGVHKTSIYNWRSQRRSPGLDEVVLLATFFRMSTDTLLGKADDDGINWVVVASRLQSTVDAHRKVREESLAWVKAVAQVMALLHDIPREHDAVALERAMRDFERDLSNVGQLLAAETSARRPAARQRRAG